MEKACHVVYGFRLISVYGLDMSVFVSHAGRELCRAYGSVQTHVGELAGPMPNKLNLYRVMSVKQSIEQAVARGAVAVWIADSGRRMDVGRSTDGYRVEFSTNRVTTGWHQGLTLREAVAIATNWVRVNR